MLKRLQDEVTGNSIRTGIHIYDILIPCVLQPNVLLSLFGCERQGNHDPVWSKFSACKFSDYSRDLPGKKKIGDTPRFYLWLGSRGRGNARVWQEKNEYIGLFIKKESVASVLIQ